MNITPTPEGTKTETKNASPRPSEFGSENGAAFARALATLEPAATSEVKVEAEPNLDVESETSLESTDAAIASSDPNAPKLPDSTGTLDVDDDDVVSEQPLTEHPTRPNVTSVPLPEGDEPLELRATPHTPARTADDVTTELVHYLHQEGITVRAARLYQRTIDERPVEAPAPAPEVAEASKGSPAPTTEPTIEIEPSSAAATGDRPLAASASPAAEARGSTPTSEAALAREADPSHTRQTTAVGADAGEAGESVVGIDAEPSAPNAQVGRSDSTDRAPDTSTLARPTPDAAPTSAPRVIHSTQATNSPTVEARSGDSPAVDASSKAHTAEVSAERRAVAGEPNDTKTARTYDAPAGRPALVTGRGDPVAASTARTATRVELDAEVERPAVVTNEEIPERAPDIAERAHGVAPRRATEATVEATGEPGSTHPRAPAELVDAAPVDTTRGGRTGPSVADANPERPVVDARPEAPTDSERAALDPNPGASRKADDAAVSAGTEPPAELDVSPGAPKTNEGATTAAHGTPYTNEGGTTSGSRTNAPSTMEGGTTTGPRPDAPDTSDGATLSSSRSAAPIANEAATATSPEGSTTADAGSRSSAPQALRPQTESPAMHERTTQADDDEAAQGAGSLERSSAARPVTKDPLDASTGTAAARIPVEAATARTEPNAPRHTQELAAPKPRPASPAPQAPAAAPPRATHVPDRPTVVAELVDHAHRVTLDADTSVAAAAAERTAQSTPAPATGATVSTPAVTVEAPPEIAVDSAEDVQIEIEESEADRAEIDEPERAASPLRADTGATGGEDRPAAEAHPARAQPDAPVEVTTEETFAATFAREATEATLRQDPARPSEQVARAHRLFAEARELARRQTMSSFRRFAIDLPVDQGAPVRLTITPDHQGHHRVALVAATHAVRAELERHRHELEEIVEAFPLDVTELSIDASPRAREDLRAFDERISNHGNQRPERR